MAVESSESALGTPLPGFTLPDPFGKLYSSRSLVGPKGLILAITCNHCPYAQAVWPRLRELAAEAAALGITTVAINPNLHPDYPDDSPEAMQVRIGEWHLDFPYLVDEGQAVARALGAQCTPEFFLYDGRRSLVYHGRFDDNWKVADHVKRHELRDAVRALAAGEPVADEQYAALGCSIKWR
jgi:peroxiredoxin